MVRHRQPFDNEGKETGRCECCRQTKRLTRHHIVPYAFSRYFDQEVYPNNRMMVCRSCHDLIEIELHKFRKFFRGKLGITEDDLRQSDEHIRYKKAKAYAWQLVSNETNIPTQKIMEMTLYIHAVYPNAYTHEDFKHISRCTRNIDKTRTHPYERIVAEKIQELGLESWFWRVWRNKNNAIVKKLRKSNIDHIKKRKRKKKHVAPEADIDLTAAMICSTKSNIKSRSDAKNQYTIYNSKNKLAARRRAYSWAKSMLRYRTESNESCSKKETIRYIKEFFDVSDYSALNFYRRSSRKRRRIYSRQAAHWFSSS